MSDLKSKILDLQNTSETLEPTEEDRNRYLAEVHAYANKFLNNLPNTKAFSNEPILRDKFKISDKQKSITSILGIYEKEIATKGINAASGGHLGYIPGGGIYTSSLADYLVDITNEYVGVNYSSPGGVAVELEILDWLKTIFGFPQSAIGNLASGGSIANLIALTAARDKYGIKNDRITKSVIYVSQQVHHCINKALKIIGLEDVIIHHVELDSGSRIIPDDLQAKIDLDVANGLSPFMVIASAGTTDTGAIDPLNELAEIATKNGL